MKNLLCLLAMALGLMLGGGGTAQAASIHPAGLVCETMTNPQGLDTPAPRLAWHSLPEASAAGRRGLRQTACQVLVASSAEILDAGQGDLWDSGRVQTDRSVGMVYAGQPLQSLQACFWKVRVWDQDDQPSAWSEPAQWTMGVLQPGPWTAQWLGYQPEAEKDRPDAWTLEGAFWIWGREGLTSGQTVPAGERCVLRRVFTLPEGKAIRSAEWMLAVSGLYKASINGAVATETYGHIWSWKRARKVDVSHAVQPGRNVLTIEARTDTAGPVGVLARLRVVMEDGQVVMVDSDEAWRWNKDVPKGWDAVAFDDAAWPQAGVWGEYGVEPWGRQVVFPRPLTPAPIFRKSFTVEKPLRRAVLCMTGLGFYEPRLNGEKIGDQVLEPSQTNYNRSVLYRTWDVTKRISAGENVLGVMLGNGWYNVRTIAVWNYDIAPWRDEPRFLSQLQLEFQDGTTQTILSDPSWRAAYGPVTYDCIRSGETFDAQAWPGGWDRAGFDDSRWDPAQAVDAPKGQLRAAGLPPAVVAETIRPVALAEPRPGVFVFDLGQNIAGWARIKVNGPAGACVTLRYSERIDAEGNINRDTLDVHLRVGEFQTDRYTLAGTGEERWEPRFTYHGFQYVEVTGWPGRPTLDSLQGCVVQTDFPMAGSFQSSNDLLNKIQQATLWSYRGNFVDGYPTDCPQREKNGWTGDAHLAAEQAQYNFQNTAGYEKWLGDLRDEQQPDGNLPGIVPTAGWGYQWGNGPAWDSALVLIPWYLYRYQDDLRVLEENYEAMKRYVDFMSTKAKDHLVDHGLGDWVAAKTQTPTVVTSSGYYYQNARIVAETARLLGRTGDAETYGTLADAIRAAWNASLDKGDGIYANGSQTALSCALYQGLAPVEARPLVARHLAEAVDAADGHLDVGILGAKYLFHALSDNGYADRAYTVATQTTPPSYGDWIVRGSTTLWEDWKDGDSRNHIMFGDISTWFYQTLAGLRLGEGANAFREMVIAPKPVGDLTWVRAEHRSPYGPIAVAWKKKAGRLTLDVAIPVNTRAVIHVPEREGAAVTEGGQPAASAPGVEYLRTENGMALYAVGSGQYRFQN